MALHSAKIQEERIIEKMKLLARFFRGLGDPTRLYILDLLRSGEKTVGELVETLGIAQGRVSVHLACLRHCGYVSTRSEGRYIYYSLADRKILKILALGEDLVASHARRLMSCAVLEEER